MIDRIESEKDEAASEALCLLQDAMKNKKGVLLGIGSGTTVHKFIAKLGSLEKGIKDKIRAVPSSIDTEVRLRGRGIICDEISSKSCDLTIDGADKVLKPSLKLLKGGGGCMTREKIISTSSRKFVVIIDSSKLVNRFENLVVPIEVLPFGWKATKKLLKDFGVTITLRQGINKLGPVITDNNNYILDAKFTQVPNVIELESEINALPGVVENGLFGKGADLVIIGHKDCSKLLEPEN